MATRTVAQMLVDTLVTAEVARIYRLAGDSLDDQVSAALDENSARPRPK
ncbi:hypothetical protein [Nannocystis sp. SCPEA4]|nr:hypothetical protein [Nannocystis sp. SCPEA4]MCY1054025.1 hypothetical protein [Nannocystis sp. SCPEA4]